MQSTATNHEAYLRTGYFRSLDGIRCFCILAVIWHHCPAPFRGPKFLEMGFLGVDMFFVLSGFLIVTLLRRERDRTGTINLKNFYARRTLRIFPIYYLLLFSLSCAVLILKPGSATARSLWADLPFLVTYTANWVPITALGLGIFWSLATEEQFYLIWPSMERYLKPPAALALLAVLVIVNQLMNFGALDPLLVRLFGAQFLALPIVQATFTPILLGVLLAHLLNQKSTYELIYRGIGNRWSPLILSAVLLLICEFAPGDISGLPRLAIQCTMAVLLGSLVIREDHVARRVLSFRPIARLGMISYGIYLYHMWGNHLVSEVFERAGFRSHRLFFPASVITTALIAELSFRLIESPLLRWKARFSAVSSSDPQGRSPILGGQGWLRLGRASGSRRPRFSIVALSRFVKRLVRGDLPLSVPDRTE